MDPHFREQNTIVRNKPINRRHVLKSMVGLAAVGIVGIDINAFANPELSPEERISKQLAREALDIFSETVKIVDGGTKGKGISISQSERMNMISAEFSFQLEQRYGAKQ